MSSALLPLIETRNLRKVFGHGEASVHAVEDVSLAVSRGELVLIMGPSGSGKTTLLTLMGGLARPTSGSVLIDGEDITAVPESRLVAVRRTMVGFIFQSFNLWESLSVVENVELPLNMAGVRGRGATAAATALLHASGLDHRLRVRPRDLSGGEKQRVSIARALVNRPRLLLADEPTANLDSRHGRDVMQLLLDVARSGDRAVVVVSHDQRIREIADRVLWLEDGRVSDIGELARDPVCGMAVEPESAMSLEHDGRTFYFCSSACRVRFRPAAREPLPREAHAR
jgi:putative ABC transport system ATP-binding protein